jgi:DNA-binding MarR family transcriptional regulator
MNIRGARSTPSDGGPDPKAAARSAERLARPQRPLADEVLDELTSWQSRLRMATFQNWARNTLSIVHLSVLAALEAHGPLSMTKLAETMDVSVASATGIVTRMEKRGVVRRRHDESDRRVVLVEITSAGAKVARVMEKHRNQRLRKLLDGLTDEELASFLFGLRALAAARARLEFEKTESGIVVARKRDRGR